MAKARVNLLVVGGDGCFSALSVEGTAVQAFPSTLHGGNGSLRRVVARIRGGAVDLVVLLVRWLGHADRDAVVAACAGAGVPYLEVRGGRSATRREVGAYLARH